MTILINCSNLKKGGGLQVADSICSYLNNFQDCNFIIVLSTFLNNVEDKTRHYKNCKTLIYNSNNGLKVLLTGRDHFLDKTVEDYNIDVVFSIFGPISWNPKCPHLCGFALSHLVLNESPYFLRMPKKELLKNKVYNKILKYYFKRGVTAFFTENDYISKKWQLQVGNTPVYTITNYYNQVFDNPDDWVEHKLPVFDGITILSISANYPHKNLEIAIPISKYFIGKYPNLNFRFIFTIDENQYPELDIELKSHFLFIGKTDIREAPSLYKQATIMFQPTLLECFTATYPEAMRMNVPIVTTDLEFARGLCGNAAIYYDSLDAEDAAKAIYKVHSDNNLRSSLIENGKKQLTHFDNYEQRAIKLISIAKEISKKHK